MPSRPASPPLVTGPCRSMNVDTAVVLSTLAKDFTMPPCSTTYQRVSSPGACNRRMGDENVRFGKTRVEVTERPKPGCGVARQVVLPGLASRPLEPEGGGFVGGPPGGGSFCTVSGPPPQPASAAQEAIAANRHARRE